MAVAERPGTTNHIADVYRIVGRFTLAAEHGCIVQALGHEYADAAASQVAKQRLSGGLPKRLDDTV
jgi:hypothetical protein